MKFSVSSIAVLSLFAGQTLALTIPRAASDGLESRQNRGGQGGFRGGNGQPQRPGQGQQRPGQGQGQGAKTTTAAAAAQTTTAANNNKGGGAAAASSTAAAAATSAAAGTGKAGAATGAAANNGGGDIQKSLTLDPSQVQSNANTNGQEAGAEAGQAPSLISPNNFINFCATQKTTISNGLQTKAGSCNPTIMGRIPSTANLPASKFSFPANGGNVDANTDFTIQMKIQNLAAGTFTNPTTTYFVAPCQVDGSGNIVGHTHVVVQKIASMGSTDILDPNTFAFFKGINVAAVNGVLSATVAGGLPAGTYRLGSLNACSNHQMINGPVAQRGLFDDVVYFTSGGAAGAGAAAAGGAAAGGAGKGAAASSAVVASTTKAAAASATAKAGGNGGGKFGGGKNRN